MAYQWEEERRNGKKKRTGSAYAATSADGLPYLLG